MLLIDEENCKRMILKKIVLRHLVDSNDNSFVNHLFHCNPKTKIINLEFIILVFEMSLSVT